MSDLANFLKDLARECRARGTAASKAMHGETDKAKMDYSFGRTTAFGEILSIILQEIDGYGITPSDIGLAGFDPDRDLS